MSFTITNKNRAIYDGLPHFIEFVIALLGFIFILPILIVLAIIIKLTSKGSFLFKQKRVGLNGKSFVLYKFRTMQVINDGPQITVKEDNRITWIGGILRKTKLDELPELWNILRGDMSIVGPRPEVPDYVDLENPLWRKVLLARPGITDPVTLRLRNEEELLSAAADPVKYYLEILQPEKLKGYLKYLHKRTWKSDLCVIKDTCFAILFPFETPVPKVDDKFKQKTSNKNKSLFYSILNSSKFKMLVDILVLVFAFVFSYLIRFEFAVPQALLQEAYIQLLVVVTIQYFILRITGISDFIWRYISVAELEKFIWALVLSATPFLLFRVMEFNFLNDFRVPYSIIITDSFYAFGGLIGVRLFRRLMYERYEKRQISTSNLNAEKIPTFLIGAGRTGQLAAREIMGRGDSKVEIAGFIDDDQSKLGKVLMGIKVIGNREDLPRLVQEIKVKEAILTITNAESNELLEIVEICNQANLNLRIMPGLYNLLNGNLSNEPDSILNAKSILKNNEIVKNEL